MDNDKKKSPKKPDPQEDDQDLFLRFLEEEGVPDKDAGRQPSHEPRSLKKAKNTEQISIDLHGMTLSEALALVDQTLSSLVVKLSGDQSVRIITGKGRHSSEGSGVLVRGVYEHVKRQWSAHIKRIDSPPADDLIEGLPFRGHFDVVLTRR